MGRMVLDDSMWSRLENLLPKNEKGGRPGSDVRLFLEAVCWILRTGAPWRDLPPGFGNWKTVYNRYNRWAKTGRIERILEVLKKRWRSRMAHAG